MRACMNLQPSLRSRLSGLRKRQRAESMPKQCGECGRWTVGPCPDKCLDAIAAREHDDDAKKPGATSQPFALEHGFLVARPAPDKPQRTDFD